MLAETGWALLVCANPGTLLRKTALSSLVSLASGGLRDFPRTQVPVTKVNEEVRHLTVTAQVLPFLNYLIAEPIAVTALYRSGILRQIPSKKAFS